MTLVSINVCVRDGVSWVDECLHALVNQTHRPLEIILVDDGSSDGTSMKVKEWGKHELVESISTSPLGLSAARMTAVEASKGTWVAITDIDVRPEPDWIEKMLLQLSASEEENVYAVTGRTRFGRADDIVSQVRSIEIETKYQNRSRRTSLANGPCSMFLREKLLSVGGFNPEWYHAEDMEVSLLLIQAGGQIIYTPEAIVSHVPETEFSRFFKKRMRDARAHTRIARKYPIKSRQGPGFDFMGSSWLILCLIPLLTINVSIIAANQLYNVEFFSLPHVLSFTLLVIWAILFWRNPIFLVILKKPFSGFVLLILWSLAIWLGIILGVFDAVTKRNGHP